MQGPDDSVQAVAVEQAGDWVGIAGVAVEGAVTLHTLSDQFLATLEPGGGGFFGLWNRASPDQGRLLASHTVISAGATLPTATGAADVLYRATQRGFTPDLGGECAVGTAAGSQVHFAHLAPGPGGACSRPRLALDGTLLDAKQAVAPWGLFRADSGACSITSALSPNDDRPVGSCDLNGSLLVHDVGGEDRTFVGMSQSGSCGDGPGIVEGTALDPNTTWCDPDTDASVRVVPFHLDATYLHFMRADLSQAALWKVPRDGGEAVMTADLCTGCVVKDAVAAAGAVYVLGDATASIELYDESITIGSAFWAWVGLADL